MKTNWKIQKENPKLSQKLADRLGLTPTTAQILINRGIETEAEANLFMNCSLFDLPSPYLMKGMDKAVERIQKALENKEKIAIYGDYDVDGVTSTALFYTFLKSLGADVTFYNPDRQKEGYGVNFESVKSLAAEGVTLIISGDCGITAVNEVEEAKKIGVDFIITDHHKPPREIPRAVSVLNPQLKDCKYPAKGIAGVGVIFNLAIGLRRALREAGHFKNGEPNLADYLDLVALGTVADCAPLLDVNRIFVKEGVKRMTEPKRIGVQALKEVSSLKGEVNSFDLGFKLGPRVNASGRMGSAKEAVDLFISENLEEARELAKALSQANSNRQSTESEILKDAVLQIETNPEYLEMESLVLASKNWHPGIIGIVASRIVERYEKPTVLIAVDAEGIGKGSSRSVGGIDIYQALLGCRELFDQFGGHEQAAGFTISEDKIPTLREMLHLAIKDYEVIYTPQIIIDCLVNLQQVTENLISEFEELSPFGIGNPEPVLMAESVEVIQQRIFKDKHLGLKIRQDDKVLDAIWFNMKEPTTIPDKIDLAFTPEFNKWNGRIEIRIKVLDVSY